MSAAQPDAPAACEGAALLGWGEYAFLAHELPHGAHVVNTLLRCEMSAGHLGPHHSLGQSGSAADGEQEWWLRWDGVHDRLTGREHARQLVQLAGCPVQSEWVTELGDTEPCTLHAAHTGAHGYDYDPQLRADAPVPDELDPSKFGELEWPQILRSREAGLTVRAWQLMLWLNLAERAHGQRSPHHEGTRGPVVTFGELAQWVRADAATTGLAAAAARGLLHASQRPGYTPPTHTASDGTVAAFDTTVAVRLTDTGRATLAQLDRDLAG